MKVTNVYRDKPPVDFIPIYLSLKIESLKEAVELKKALGPLTVGYELYQALNKIIQEEEEKERGQQ